MGALACPRVGVVGLRISEIGADATLYAIILGVGMLFDAENGA